MIWNSVSILLALSAFGVLVASSDRSIDCRKFVFAPLCRGVAAKRMSADGERGSSSVYLANKRDFWKNIYLVGSTGSNENENEKESNFLRKIYLRLMNENNINKLFQESKRINSDLKNAIIFVHDYNNL